MLRRTSWLMSIFRHVMATTRRSGRRFRQHPSAACRLERLEPRVLLSAFNAVGDTLNIDVSTNETVQIVSNGSSYTLTSSGTWSGTNSVDLSGNGTNTLTVTAAGLAAFNSINLNDTGSGAAVKFNDSHANAYADSISVSLDDPNAGAITFNGASHFSGSATLMASGSAIDAGGAIITDGGSLGLISGTSITVSGQVTTSGGAIQLRANSGITLNNSLNSAGGAVDVKADNDGDGNGTLTLSAAVLNSWTEQSTLTATGGVGSDFFGGSVALSADGNTAIVGARVDDVGVNVNQGTATVFVRSGGVWIQQQQLTAIGGAADDGFGIAVSLSADGNTAIIGAIGDDVGGNVDQGTATVFVRSGGVWTQQQQLTANGGAANDFFGNSVVLSADGNTAIIGAFSDDVGANEDQGTVVVFVRSAGVWTQQQQLTGGSGGAGDFFGVRVAMSADGNTALVGASQDRVGNGKATVFVRAGGVWTAQQQLTAAGGATEDWFGARVALSADGNTALIAATRDDVGANRDQGSVTVFVRSGGIWSQQQQLTVADGAMDDLFGTSVSLSADGNIAVIGVQTDDVGANLDQGSARVFVRSGAVWTQKQILTAADGAANDTFGVSVALSADGNTILVGASGDEFASGANQGSARIFTQGTPGGAIAALGGTISLTAADASLNGSISSTSTVSLASEQLARSIDLGSNTAGTLGLTDSELDFINASQLNIGNISTGTINFSAPIDLAGTNSLQVSTGGNVTQSFGGTALSGDTLIIKGNLAPGVAATGSVTVNGAVTFDPAASYRINLNGPASFDQLQVVGTNRTTSLGGADLQITLDAIPPATSKQVFRIIDSTGTGSTVSGSFKFGGTTLNDGDIFNVGGTIFKINYNPVGAAGDVTLTEFANTPPIVDLNGADAAGTSFNATFIENFPAVAISDTDATLSDAEQTTLASLTLIVNSNPDGAAESLAVAGVNVTLNADKTATGTVGGTTFLVAYVASTRTLTITVTSGTGAIADFQSLLRNVTYKNTSDTPSTANRTITVTAYDGVVDSIVATTTITVSATNDAPTLSNIEANPLPYVPKGPATIITSTLSLGDPDSATLTGATIRITAGQQNGDVLSFADKGNISGSYNPATGILTLTGTDSVANYQDALRSVTYVSSDKRSVPRTVSFQVNDGTAPSNTVTRTIGGIMQLVGTTLNVYGLPEHSGITVSEGATLNVSADGVVAQYSPAQVTAINIYGNEGEDIIVINSLAVGTTLSVYGEQGSDTIRVDSSVTQGVTLDGGEGQDLLIGGSGNDILIGGDGNDWLNGGEGNDRLSGGIGNDVYGFSDTATNQIDTVVEKPDEGTDLLNFSAVTEAVTVNLTSDPTLATMAHRIVQTGAAGQAINFENVFGGSKNDVITGNSANNLLYGNGGNDTLSGGDGYDQLDGGQGNDLLKGGNQDDALIGGLGDDYLKGDAGNDSLNGGDGFNALVGGTENDVYIFLTASVNQVDTINELAGEGVDTLDFSALVTPVTANLASDTALATMNFRIVQTGTGQSANFENVFGGSANDFITGNAKNNHLLGNGGNDRLTGGDGSDQLEGGQGNDLLEGGNQDDVLIGGIGDDNLNGGADNDWLYGGDGFNVMAGGKGNDKYLFDRATVNQLDTVNELADEGTDTLDFSTLVSAVTVNLTNDTALATMDRRIVQAGVGQSANIENAFGGSGNDQMTGNDGSNFLAGGEGNDTISGGAGNDIILGNAGNDTLNGGGGRNILIGGGGGDLLAGGTSEDMLVSGSSVFETDSAVMQAILAEWASANSYQTRVDHLLGTTGGGANSTFTLNRTTVTTDLDADYMTGGTGQDWFLANSLQDVITDKAVDEVFTRIDTWV